MHTCAAAAREMQMQFCGHIAKCLLSGALPSAYFQEELSHLYPVRQFGCTSQAVPISDHLNPHHEAQAAHIPQVGASLLQRLQARPKVGAHLLGGLLQALLLDHLQHRQPCAKKASRPGLEAQRAQLCEIATALQSPCSFVNPIV